MSNQMIKKTLYIDTKILNGHSMSQILPYDEIKIDRSVTFEDKLNYPDDNDVQFFVEVDLSYPNDKEGKSEIFQFCLENKIISKNDFIEYMEKIKPKTYKRHKNLFF